MNFYQYALWDPIIKRDPSGLTPGDPFSSPEDAAYDVLAWINPNSIRENAEYGGIIYKEGEKYFASWPDKGAGDHVPLYFKGNRSQLYGDYHTHGDYSVRGSDGKAVRTTKDRDQYDSDHFSGGRKTRPGDKENSAILQKWSGTKGYKSYLGTPSGQFKQFNPETGKEQELIGGPDKQGRGGCIEGSRTEHGC